MVSIKEIEMNVRVCVCVCGINKEEKIDNVS